LDSIAEHTLHHESKCSSQPCGAQAGTGTGDGETSGWACWYSSFAFFKTVRVRKELAIRTGGGAAHPAIHAMAMNGRNFFIGMKRSGKMTISRS
jgi:hypothetical protein